MHGFDFYIFLSVCGSRCIVSMLASGTTSGKTVLFNAANIGTLLHGSEILYIYELIACIMNVLGAFVCVFSNRWLGSLLIFRQPELPAAEQSWENQRSRQKEK